MGEWIRIVLAVLATWRVTHLLANEDGPADIVVKFRALLGESLTGKLMDCFKCLSLWIAAPMAIFVTQRLVDWLLVWLALSGGACLLERLGREPAVVEPIYEPSEGDDYHVLRTETSGVTEQRAEVSIDCCDTVVAFDPAEPIQSWGTKGWATSSNVKCADNGFEPACTSTAANDESSTRSSGSSRIPLCSH